NRRGAYNYTYSTGATSAAAHAQVQHQGFLMHPSGGRQPGVVQMKSLPLHLVGASPYPGTAQLLPKNVALNMGSSLQLPHKEPLPGPLLQAPPVLPQRAFLSRGSTMIQQGPIFTTAANYIQSPAPPLGAVPTGGRPPLGAVTTGGRAQVMPMPSKVVVTS
ncbi:unnamed protein product, partial [Amoebophrya sp. A25]